MSRFTSLALLASLALAPACKNDLGTGPSNPSPVASVTLDRTSVTLAKGDQTRLTATVLVDLPDSQSYPAWSPDGRLIAFTSFHEGPLSPFVIYTVRSDGTGLTRRTNQPWWSNQPTWGVRP